MENDRATTTLLNDDPAGAAGPKSDRAHPLTRLGKRILQAFNGLIARGSIHPDATFYDSLLFPWIARLEASYPIMRRELDQLLADRESIPAFHEISADQYNMSRDYKWRTFFLYGYGLRADGNCARCPETTRLVESIPGMKTAMFSILEGRKHIPPHEGPYKGVLRYHLALKVPNPPGSCRIRVGGVMRAWEEGRSLVFDDSYTHEAWNDTDEVRAVLFVDIVRPMRPPMKWLNSLFLRLIRASPFITRAAENFRRLEVRPAVGRQAG